MSYRIYVASLADYNNGVLHGVWIDLEEANDADLVREEIASMLALSPTAQKTGEPAEEWEIHDMEDLQDLGLDSSTSLEDYCYHAKMLSDHGEAWRIFVHNLGWGDYAIDEAFKDAYQGMFNDEKDFAWDFLESSGALSEMPEHLQAYFDIDMYARDLFLESVWGEYDSEGNFHVFLNI